MSCRSRSDAYKSVLTDRFMDLTNSKPFDIHNAEVFKHQPLQDPSTELRYLYLRPKTHNIHLDGQTVVCCELLSSAKEKVPSYAGLSYTWGNPQIRRLILVGDKISHATENIAIALEHLQEEDKTTVFWIDAICIDQSNSNEKSIQVQRMGDIFASAVLVIAWVGPAADDSDLALQELETYGEDAPKAGLLSLKQFEKAHGERFAALRVDLMKAFFARSWFKRVWVGQEVALNQQVIFVCGQRDIHRKKQPVDSLVALCSSLVMLKGDVSLMGFMRLEYTEALPLRDFLRHHIVSVYLALGGELESSDPRDFVYSSFGRISDVAEYGLHVDYTKSVEEVYPEFAEAIIRCWRDCLVQCDLACLADLQKSPVMGSRLVQHLMYMVITFLLSFLGIILRRFVTLKEVAKI